MFFEILNTHIFLEIPVKVFLLILIGMLFCYSPEVASGKSYPEPVGSIRAVDVADAASSAGRPRRDGARSTQSPAGTSEAIAVAADMPKSNSRVTDSTRIVIDGDKFKAALIFFILTIGLLGLIGGLAILNDKLVSDIFSHGGLRFIALVLILMALVLFGVTAILEAKEISALLGTIAGYILGAGASGDFGSSKPEKEDVHQISGPAARGQAS